MSTELTLEEQIARVAEMLCRAIENGNRVELQAHPDTSLEHVPKEMTDVCVVVRNAYCPVGRVYFVNRSEMMRL